MNVQVFLITLMTATVALMSALPAAVDSPVIDQSPGIYAAYINKYISRCQTKETLFKNLKLKNHSESCIPGNEKSRIFF